MNIENSVKAMIKNHASPEIVKALRQLRYKHAPIRSVFTQVYFKPVANRECVSGSGSTLDQTAEISRRIPELIEQLGIRTLLDAPCGDFFWLSKLELNLEKYIGVDIVRELVMRNADRFGGNGRLFMCLDLTTDKLPTVDLVLSRDMTVHLSNRDCLAAFRNFKRSRSQYLLTTTFPDCPNNEDILTGEWRTLNLQIAPFNFPEPILMINERCTEDGGRYSDKSLGLWRIEDLPDFAHRS